MASVERRRLRDHPAGLWVLAGTELWDRISFRGMQALLVLYMVDTLLRPGTVERIRGFAGLRTAIEALTGPLSVQALAAQVFGLYVAFVYFTPIIGGWIGDRLTGRRVAVAGGALMMTAGHFALAFDATFLVALLLLILGAGLLRGNLGAQVKALYADGDPRAVDAFQLYYIAINLGSFIAPLATGALAALYGWHVGFAVAGVGMLIGLVVYLAGQRYLPPDAARVAAVRRVRSTPAERRRIAGLALVFPCQTGFWIAQSQVWNVYNLWVRDHVDLRVGGFAVPVPWLQALDGLAPILAMPLILALWRHQAARGREPGAVAKLAIGCAIFAAGTLWLAAAPLVAGGDGRVALGWAIVFHLLSNVGWLYFAPTSTALYAMQSPPALRGTLIGASSLAVFVASIVSGRIGGLYETLSPTAFWSLHAAIVGASGVALLLLAPTLHRRFIGETA